MSTLSRGADDSREIGFWKRISSVTSDRCRVVTLRAAALSSVLGGIPRARDQREACRRRINSVTMDTGHQAILLMKGKELVQSPSIYAQGLHNPEICAQPYKGYRAT